MASRFGWLTVVVALNEFKCSNRRTFSPLEKELPTDCDYISTHVTLTKASYISQKITINLLCIYVMLTMKSYSCKR